MAVELVTGTGKGLGNRVGTGIRKGEVTGGWVGMARVHATGPLGRMGTESWRDWGVTRWGVEFERDVRRIRVGRMARVFRFFSPLHPFT